MNHRTLSLERILLVTSVALGLLALSAPLWLCSACKYTTPTVTPTVVPPTPTATPDPPAFCDLQVTVRDAETGSPVVGADVQIGEQQGSTNKLGVYALRVSNGSVHPVRVSSPGYKLWQGHADAALSGTSKLTLDISLEAISVRGQVVGQGLEPLPDATVTFHGQPVPLDSEGRFTLRHVRANDIVTAEHPGYHPHQATWDGYPALYLRLEPLATTLSMRDAMTGQAIPRVSVCTVDEQCQSSDELGEVTFRPIAQGASLSAHHRGYHSGHATYEGQDLVTLELSPRELYGTIRDAESGQPLTNTILMVNGQVVPLDKEGRYHLPDLTHVYTLFVKSPGYERVTIPIGPETKTSRYDALDTCLQPDKLPCADISLPRFAVRGIYANFNLLMWDKKRMLELIDLIDRSPILNAIVVDIKGDYGYIAFESTDPVIVSGKAMRSPRLPVTEFLRLCKEKHIYTIARMVIFKDSPLIEARPELAVRHPNGAIFYDREGLAWGDPTREEVWEYNIAITKEAIRLGFDEIQYDYLRFPSDSTSLAVVRALVYSVPSTLESRTAAIEGFVAAAKAAVDPTPAFLSTDLFGYALSVDPEHDMRIGQRLKDLAPHADYVCPMVYPSTFIPGNLGLISPSDSPYEVVARSMQYGHSRTNTVIRPWLQHYWYSRYELAEQRRAAEEATTAGWCFWNAGAAYDELFFIPPKGIEP